MVIHAGKRKKRLAGDELAGYVSSAGKRGMKLPQGFQKVDRLDME